MNPSKAFHLGVSKADLAGATLAIIPGDPARVARIADKLEGGRKIAEHREFCTYLGKLATHSVVISSTGIGGPSTSICVEELASLGVKTFIRIGTSGAIQSNISVGDVVVTNGSVRLDGASSHFAPLEFPAVANFEVTRSLKDSADGLGIACHVGVTASSDTFYPGQERYDTYSGKVLRRFQGSLEEFQSWGVLNYEMESATLLTMAQVLGLRAGCVSGIIVNRACGEKPDEKNIAQIERNVIKISILAARKLLGLD